MDVEWFREFVVLAETMHYSKAADKLFTTQSSLSKHIMAMEKQLGGALFSRQYHNLVLTEFGKVVLPYAYDIISLMNRCEDDAYGFLHGRKKKLRIRAIPALPAYHITDLIVQYQETYSDVQVELSEADSVILRRELLDGKCDLVVMREPTGMPVLRDTQAVSRIVFQRDHLVAAVPLSHPLADRGSVTLQELAEERFVFIKEGTLPYELCMSACKEAGFIPRLDFTTHNRDAMIDMVTKGGKTALLFSSHVETLKNHGPGFAVLDVKPAIQTDIVIACLNNGQFPAYAEDFLKMCKDYADVNIDS